MKDDKSWTWEFIHGYIDVGDFILVTNRQICHQLILAIKIDIVLIYLYCYFALLKYFLFHHYPTAVLKYKIIIK